MAAEMRSCALTGIYQCNDAAPAPKRRGKVHRGKPAGCAAGLTAAPSATGGLQQR